MIFAPRRYGKSSLIWRVAQGLVKEKVLVAQVDLMTTPTKEAPRGEARQGDPRGDRLGALSGQGPAPASSAGLRITPTVTVDPEDGSVSFSFEAGRASEAWTPPSSACSSSPAASGRSGSAGWCSCSTSSRRSWRSTRGLPRLMRSVFQEQPDVAHVYLGSKRR